MCINRKIFLLGLVLFISCSTAFQEPEIEHYSKPLIEVFFSPPEDLNHKLVQYIDDAQKSIRGCFYGIKSEEVAHALIKAHLRGVKVQIIIDEDRLFLEGSYYPKLKNFGLAKKDIITKGLMHHKFCVIDEKIVWTGSYNPNNYAIYGNNDAVVIESGELADRYIREFNELWGDGVGKRQELGGHNVKIEDITVEVYFSPKDSALILDRMLEIFANATSSIYFGQFTITHPDIARILIEQAKKGIEIKGIMEYDQIGSYSKYPWFELADMNVRKDKNYSFAFHHKFFIIDEKIVITGSLNSTKSAFNRNRENILIINSAEVAKRYLRYFEDVP